MLSVAPVFIVFTHESLYGDWYPRNAVKRINQKAVKHLEIEFFLRKHHQRTIEKLQRYEHGPYFCGKNILRL